MIICKADKPRFFSNEGQPFYEYDPKDQMFRGGMVEDLSEVKERNVVEGSCRLLEEYIE